MDVIRTYFAFALVTAELPLLVQVVPVIIPPAVHVVPSAEESIATVHALTVPVLTNEIWW